MTTLPDFLFGRDHALEHQGGYVLAGKLVTNIPKSRRKLTPKENRLISQVIRTLVHEVAMEPHLTEAGIWLDGCRPVDGAQPPFDTEQVFRARTDACIVVGVVVDRETAAGMH
jgi:hypothetical protein